MRYQGTKIIVRVQNGEIHMQNSPLLLNLQSEKKVFYVLCQIFHGGKHGMD